MKRKKLHLKIKKRPAEYYRILFLRTLGNFMILSSLFMITKTFYEPVLAESRFFVSSYFGRQYVIQGKNNNLENQEVQPGIKGALGKLLNVQPIEIIRPEDPNYSIVIPKIGANARILANVDAGNEKQYLEALKKGVAHALGTSFPGEGGLVYLFAHSTDYIWNFGNYNAIFYLLYKLEKGDEISVYYKNQRYVYRVLEKRIIDPKEIEYLTRKSNAELLTLQTCWPPGTTLQRLLIFATRVAE